MKTAVSIPDEVSAKVTALPQDSVANASQIVALDKTWLTDRVSKLSKDRIDSVLAGVDVVLGR